MTEIHYRILKTGDQKIFRLIADWYLKEWKIPTEKTIRRLQNITEDNLQFQVLMTFNNMPVATGGIYNHVGLVDKVPELKHFKKWLALVYTIPGERGKGYGALLCNFIQDHSKKVGIDTIYLFTDTAERLYKRLGWNEMERLELEGRKIIIMQKTLQNKN